MKRLASLSLVVCLSTFVTTGIKAQQEAVVHPPDYRGVSTLVAGVFVTPVPNAPFSGTVEVLSKQPLDDGGVYVRRTVNHIARNSAGVIYNERRQLVPPTHVGEPALLSAHIYDPQIRLNIFYNPSTHIARQSVRPEPLRAPAGAVPQNTATNPLVKEEDLGLQTIAGLALHGTRKSRTLPASAAGSQHEIVVTDEYWYSEDLHMYMIVKHNDPRTGEQIVAITEATRSEPDPSRFTVPEGYKFVDETPVPALLSPQAGANGASTPIEP